MSKLDYVTIAIVAICFAAIIFLIVKITQLMNRDQTELEPNRIEETLGEENQPPVSDDVYDATTGQAAPDDVEEPMAAGAEEGSTGMGEEEDYYDTKTDDEDRFGDEVAEVPPPAVQESDEPVGREEEFTARGGQPETAQPRESARSATGDYMVLAGSFRLKHNADSRVRRLRELGYEDARVGYFNKGTYAVAVVGRYAEEDMARSVIEELEKTHKIDARLQKN